MGLQWKTKAQIDADAEAEKAAATLGIPAGATISVDGKVIGTVAETTATTAKVTPPAKPASPLKKASTKAAAPAATAVVQEAKAEVKTTAKPKVAGKAVITDEMKLVDELVLLDQWMTQNEVEAKTKRVGELKKLLQSIAADMPPTVEAVLTGMTGVVTFSPAKVMTNFTGTQADLKAALTPEVYEQLASVTLTDAKKYLSEIELDKLTVKEYGSRVLKACALK